MKNKETVLFPYLEKPLVWGNLYSLGHIVNIPSTVENYTFLEKGSSILNRGYYKTNPMANYGETVQYKIKIKGELDTSWSEYFGNIRIASEKDETGSVLTTLEMDAADQSTFFGLLNHLQDLNLSLLSVTSSNKEETEK